MSATRWEKSAERENARRRRDAPLFVAAGIVPLATPEEREAAHERGMADFAARQAQSLRRCLESANAHRDEILAARGAEFVAEIDRAWDGKGARGAPTSHEYLADFWHSKKRELGLCRPSTIYGPGFCACSEPSS
jgi:hypothetical protein